MTGSSDEAGDLVVAWRRACGRLAALGETISGAPFPRDDAALVEGLEHLVDQASLWLAWETLHADPSRPFFHRHNDLVSQWGGPNADNVYRHARIEPGRRYRITGRMHACDDFVLTVRAGFMHRSTWGTLAQLTASDREIGPGDGFEVLLGGAGPAAVPVPEGAVMVSIREYYYDWRPDEPATFVIECLDPEPGRVPPLADRLDESLNEIEDSVTYWQRYLADNRAERTDNTFSATTVAKGLSVARYEFCFWDLGPDEALVIEADEPAARYWAVQLYMMPTFELVDPYGCISSRNHTQVERSADGKIRLVVSAPDPGVANWLETGGRRNGLCTFRWFWPTADASPALATRVVPVAEVVAVLDGEPTRSNDQRVRERAARQEHLRWRFRS